MIQILHFFYTGFIEEDLVKPLLHFKFYWFSFLEPVSAEGFKAILLLMCIAAILMITGYIYRIAVAFYFFSFTYLWLLDKGFFNNHYYLISILCGMMFFLPADAWNPFRKGRSHAKIQIQRWQLGVLQAQIFIVFLWGGLNKINAGWLVQQQPIDFILAFKADFTGNPTWDSEFLKFFMIWGGLLFDLLIIPALWWRKTRYFALAGMLIFNGFNFWVFHDVGGIGIFPWLVLATTVLYFEPDIGLRLLEKFRRKKSTRNARKASRQQAGKVIKAKSQPVLMNAFLVFLLLQLLLPARHFFISGHVDWTSEGQRFAWRMKIFYKDFDMHFSMVDQAGTGNRYEVNVGNMLTQKQYTALGYYPDLIPQTARFLKKEALKKGLVNPVIQVDFRSGLNGWPSQALLDPSVDASQLQAHPMRRMDWVIPYRYGKE